MTLWPRLVVILAAGGMTLAMDHRSARACSCSEPAPVPEEVARVAAVFEGTVRAVGPSSAVALAVDFEVSRRWKGEVSRRQRVLTPSDEAACGVSFTVGESYLVYALRQTDGALNAILCSRTRSRGDAAEDLALLGPGEPPMEVPASSSGGGCVLAGRRSGGWPVLLLAAVVMLAGRARAHRRRD